MSQQMLVDKAESWRIAEGYVRALGGLSSLFTAAIRAVRNAPMILKTSDDARIHSFSIEALAFPIKVSPTLKAALYFMALEMEEEKLGELHPLSQEKLLSLFSPDQLIAGIGLTYLYRIIKRRCDADEWERLLPKMCVHLNIGYLVGQKIKGVGAGHGMLMAGARYLALALFLYADTKGFKDLRRKCDSRNKLFDVDEEQRKWGCNHMQIASCLVSQLGYGIGPRMAFGMEADVLGHTKLQAAASDSEVEISSWRTTLACIESLHAKGASPEYVRSKKSRFLTADAGAELEKLAIKVVAAGQGLKWITKSASEVPEEVRGNLGMKVIMQERQEPVQEEE